MALRDVGKTTIALDIPTRAMLKQLAGDGHVSDYVRALAERELAKTGAGRALPGQERLASPNTIAEVNSKLDRMAAAYCELFAKVEILINKFADGTAASMVKAYKSIDKISTEEVEPQAEQSPLVAKQPVLRLEEEAA